MSTQIKRLFLNKTEFVPITLAEAVVVNTTTIDGLKSLGITTLDKVLRTTLGVVGVNTNNIKALSTKVDEINTALSKKQDKLTAGTGINISDTGVISTVNTIELYKIVTDLPAASKECLNSIYLKAAPAGANGNVYKEYICIYSDSLKQYVWEEIGELKTDVDLSGYVTIETFNNLQTEVNNLKVTGITASNVTISDGTTAVIVNYNIPTDLYDSLVAPGDGDEVQT